jgi:hypothetical protein
MGGRAYRGVDSHHSAWTEDKYRVSFPEGFESEGDDRI